jgi:Cu+-exporting ATPase
MDRKRPAASEPASPAEASAELAIGGMSCAACAGRVESALNEIDGATATVNFAIERATVEYDPAVTDVDAMVAAVSRAGYTASAEAVSLGAAEDDDLGRRLWISAALAVPVLALSMIPPLQFDYWQWFALALSLVVVLWGGAPFISGAVAAARHRTATMDTLVALGSLVALGWSTVAIVFLDAGGPDVRMQMSLDLTRSGDHAEIYLEVAVGIVVLILLGRWLEGRARRRAGAALRSLLEMSAPSVVVLRDGREHEIPAASLAAGDALVVRPGERIGADGIVREGRSALDTSLITGESVPVDVGPGASVTGGAINLGGRLLVEATRVGADTTLAHMARIVSEAQAGKSRVQRLADRVSAVFVPVVLMLSLITFLGWLIAGQPLSEAATAAIAVLVIACPCALGLATPTAILAGTGRGAELGVLIRGPEVLEATRDVTLIALDKTGTLTSGRLGLTRITPLQDVDEAEALRLAAAVEMGSEHPIAEAIVAAARELGLEIPAARDFSAQPGHGARASLDGRVLEVRRAAPDVDGEADETLVELAVDGSRVAVLALTDRLRPTADEAVRALRDLGLEVVMLSGDRPAVVASVAERLAIDDARGGLDPVQKAAMVGDGVNDAPALASADLGIAVGQGADIAITASDLTMTTSDPRAIATAVRLARRTRATIVQNLVWAFGYNVLAIPLAMAGLLSPLIAAAAMAASSLFVVLNALRLRRFTPRRAS